MVVFILFFALRFFIFLRIKITFFWASRFARTSSALASGYPLHHLRALWSLGGSATIPLAENALSYK
jgi:hypothetical protein